MIISHVDTSTVVLIEIFFFYDLSFIGSGDKEVDIASVGAGQAAAAYGTPTLLPLGETYTHMRTTIGKKFIISFC